MQVSPLYQYIVKMYLSKYVANTVNRTFHHTIASPLVARISRTVYRYFRAYPFLLFSPSAFHFLIFGSVR